MENKETLIIKRWRQISYSSELQYRSNLKNKIICPEKYTYFDEYARGDVKNKYRL
jgi:hypothetical protein